MDVANNTLYPHLLFKTTAGKEKMAAAIILRVTYDIVDGKAIPSPQQKWPLSTAPWQNEYGGMEHDMIYRKGGVDVFVFGSAKALNNEPVKRMQVNIKLPGKLNHTLMVIGDRVWENKLFGLGPSEPKPFTEMPLTLANAYGGNDEWDGLQFPYPNNAVGKGFIWQKETAKGKPLPNIEDPAHLIGKWNDKPLPVGVVPSFICEKRIRTSSEFDNKGVLKKLDPRFFNQAFNEMIVPEVLPGETFTVEGVNPKGPFVFTVPDHKLNVKLCFGEKQYERKCTIDQVGMETNYKRAFITYRYYFNYTLRPREIRSLEISEE